MNLVPDTKRRPIWHARALRCLAAIDLTCLDETADAGTIDALCTAAASPYGAPAALCIHPRWLARCRARLRRLGRAQVRLATVVNFPDGSTSLTRVLREIRAALRAGAGEIDLVFPYRAFLAGRAADADAVVRAARTACGERALLKVILETGELGRDATIRAAAELAIAAGADFLKTSTGKVAVSATLEAARAMLETIRARGGAVGFKASGGIRDVETATAYFSLADELLGPAWATPERFRIGASALLGDVHAVLRGERVPRARRRSR